MNGLKTSFVGMFNASDGGPPPVQHVEIPLIQRDYAQGRESTDVETIRRDFLDVLIAAITGGDAVNLDFVYGEIKDGALRPLDGQQRLTTLFLIHWYVAARTNRLREASSFLKLAYATRPTAELFCRQLVDPTHVLTDDFATPSEWITNQAWYLYSWRHDPTVQSMLVMIDAIHDRLSIEGVDLEEIWSRLVDTMSPAISYYFLPIDDMPSGEELYIKMNSRGKPLTDFETFKARLEKLLAGTLDPARFARLVHKLDGAWADVLWRYHGGDHKVDDEFLRYFEFIIEVSEWRDGANTGGASLLDRADRAFGQGNPRSETNLDFLIHAFDTWVGIDSIEEVFSLRFAEGRDAMSAAESGKVPLADSANTNLFEAALRSYGIKRGRARQFSLGETLYLFAILIHRQYATEDIARRIRTLRNLIDGADDEVREARMPDLLPGVERLIRYGTLDELRGFNLDRVQDELEKQAFVEQYPDLEPVVHQLEDHPLLRGRIYAFDLDATTLKPRAEAFRAVAGRENWPQLTAALLAKGNYGFDLGGGRAYQFGTGSPNQSLRWREVFAHYGRARNQVLRAALGALLDEVASAAEPAPDALADVASQFVASRVSAGMFDWRHYLVAYPVMREGETGIYYGEHLRERGRWDYSMCMLRTGSLTGGAYYRDPYLQAIFVESRLRTGVDNLWFRGYESTPRWLRLSESGAGIRCVSGGLELDPPVDGELSVAFHEICLQHGVFQDGLLAVAQTEVDGEHIDAEDRVQIGASLLRDLVSAGF